MAVQALDYLTRLSYQNCGLVHTGEGDRAYGIQWLIALKAKRDALYAQGGRTIYVEERDGDFQTRIGSRPA